MAAIARFSLGLSALVALSSAGVFGAQHIPSTPPDDVLEDAQGSFIFVFQDNLSPGDIRSLAIGLTKSQEGRLRHVYSKALKGFSATLSPAAAAEIAQDPDIAYYEQNGVAYALGWGVRDASEYGAGTRPGTAAPPDGKGPPSEEDEQVTPWGIERVGGPVDGTNLHAWIIDSGIDLDHPDLNVSYGANFVVTKPDDDPADILPDDAAGHGTHVAGTVAAIDNDIDVIGVAAGAWVHPVRVLNNGGVGTTDAIIAGIDFVAANAAPGDCANMSLGGPGHHQSLHDAVINAADKGILFSLAAGNESDYAEYYEPAHVEHENVYTISAVDDSDTFASFSNYGNPPVDYAAPGVYILSTAKGGGTTVMQGTSMAAPHVCGILLLKNPPNSDGVAVGDPENDNDDYPDPIAHL